MGRCAASIAAFAYEAASGEEAFEMEAAAASVAAQMADGELSLSALGSDMAVASARHAAHDLLRRATEGCSGYELFTVSLIIGAIVAVSARAAFGDTDRTEAGSAALRSIVFMGIRAHAGDVAAGVIAGAIAGALAHPVKRMTRRAALRTVGFRFRTAGQAAITCFVDAAGTSLFM